VSPESVEEFSRSALQNDRRRTTQRGSKQKGKARAAEYTGHKPLRKPGKFTKSYSERRASPRGFNLPGFFVTAIFSARKNL
jgi:hypothetical protein